MTTIARGAKVTVFLEIEVVNEIDLASRKDVKLLRLQNQRPNSTSR